MARISDTGRVIWEDEDKKLVARRVRAMDESGASRAMSFKSMMELAQQDLDSRFHREILTEAAVPWLNSFKEIVRVEDIREAERLEQQQQEEQQRQEEAERIQLEALNQIPMGALMAAVMQRMVTSTANEVMDRLEPILSQMQAKLNVGGTTAEALAKPAQSEKLKKVLVLGVKPSQANVLKESFDGLLDIRTWKEEGPRALIDLIKSSDHITVMRGKINYTSVTVAKQYKREDVEVSMVDGGVTSLEADINTFFLRSY